MKTDKPYPYRRKYVVTVDDDVDELEAMRMVLVMMERGKTAMGGTDYPVRTNFTNGLSIRYNRKNKNPTFIVYPTRHIKKV